MTEFDKSQIVEPSNISWIHKIAEFLANVVNPPLPSNCCETVRAAVPRQSMLYLHESEAVQKLKDFSREHDFEVVKLFGPPRLQLEYFNPIFEEQITRGRLTREEASQLRQEIAKGNLKLLIQDMAIGTIIGWTSTKALTFPISIILTIRGNPELAAKLMALDIATAVWETPYFAFRAIQEMLYYNRQLKEAEVNTWSRVKYCLRRVLFLVVAVALNMLPSPLCWFNGVAITFPRNTKISLIMVHHYLDDIEKLYGKYKRFFICINQYRMNDWGCDKFRVLVGLESWKLIR